MRAAIIALMKTDSTSSESDLIDFDDNSDKAYFHEKPHPRVDATQGHAAIHGTLEKGLDVNPQRRDDKAEMPIWKIVAIVGGPSLFIAVLGMVKKSLEYKCQCPTG